MTVVEFPRKRDVESIPDFLDMAKERLAETKAHACILITLHKLDKDEEGVSIGMGGKELSQLETTGLLSLAKSRLEFAYNIDSVEE